MYHLDLHRLWGRQPLVGLRGPRGDRLPGMRGDASRVRSAREQDKVITHGHLEQRREDIDECKHTIAVPPR
jgi:hypothetical protein